MKQIPYIIKGGILFNLGEDLTPIRKNIDTIVDALNGIEIPTNVSDLENDSNFVTKQYVDNLIGDIETILTNIIGHDSGETTTT